VPAKSLLALATALLASEVRKNFRRDNSPIGVPSALCGRNYTVEQRQGEVESGRTRVLEAGRPAPVPSATSVSPFKARSDCVAARAMRKNQRKTLCEEDAATIDRMFVSGVAIGPPFSPSIGVITEFCPGDQAKGSVDPTAGGRVERVVVEKVQ
jgi:hypothetical protein